MIRTSVMALVGAVVFTACGGGSDEPTASPTGAAGAATAAPTAAQRLSPNELGDAIFARAAEGMKAVTAAVEGHPSAATAKPKVQAVKEAAVQDLVKLGRQLEPLSASDRAAVEARVSAAYSQAASSTWYKAYATATSLYNAEDAELSRQVQSFNIITQYAFFELLKKQEPAEAARLGIK